MSANVSTKSLALFVSNDTITFLTKTIQQDEVFYSEPHIIRLPDLNKEVSYEELEALIKANLPLLLYYNAIHICYLSTPVMIIPEVYHSTIGSTIFPNLNPNLGTNDVKLKNLDAYFVYNNFNNLNKIFNNLPNFKNAISTHTGKILIDECKFDQEKIQVFARIINQKLELCIFNKSIFMLYNIYDIIGDEDVIYYILNTIQQLELDQNLVEVSFEGGISSEHIALSYLPQYVQRVTYNKDYEMQGYKYLLYKIFECE